MQGSLCSHTEDVAPHMCSTRWALQVGLWVLHGSLIKSLLFGVIGFSRLIWYIFSPSGYFSKKPWVFFQGKWYFKIAFCLPGMAIVSRSLNWVTSWVYTDNSNFLKFRERERDRRKERRGEKKEICYSTYICIHWLMPWPRLKLTILEYWDDILINWAIQPGHLTVLI